MQIQGMVIQLPLSFWVFSLQHLKTTVQRKALDHVGP
jgi:hypothetical protein